MCIVQSYCILTIKRTYCLDMVTSLAYASMEAGVAEQNQLPDKLDPFMCYSLNKKYILFVHVYLSLGYASMGAGFA